LNGFCELMPKVPTEIASRVADLILYKGSPFLETLSKSIGA